MLNVSVTLDEAIDFLNSLVQIDRQAMKNIVEQRVPCNIDLANHPTVQVSQSNDGFRVGFLGIVNGLFGTDMDGWGGIAFNYDENGDLLSVSRPTKRPPDAGEAAALFGRVTTAKRRPNTACS